MLWSRYRKHSLDPSSLTTSIDIRWGLTILTIRYEAERGLVWLHDVRFDLLASPRDPSIDSSLPERSDSFSFTIDTPLRMHPGGSVTEAWRPESLDLEDPLYLRPTVRAFATATASSRFVPITTEIGVEVLDNFTFDGTRYEIDGEHLPQDGW